MGNGPVALLTLGAGVAGAVQVAVMGRFGERVGAFEALAFSAVLTAAIALATLRAGSIVMTLPLRKM